MVEGFRATGYVGFRHLAWSKPYWIGVQDSIHLSAIIGTGKDYSTVPSDGTKRPRHGSSLVLSVACLGKELRRRMAELQDWVNPA